MPPITKYSKDKIIETGLKLVQKNGMDSISARNIAKELGCSIQPVFFCFESMDVLKKELLNKIYEIYSSYIEDNMRKNDKPFKGAGLGYIKFAKENKNYFKALFMQEVNKKISSLLDSDENNNKLEKVISRQYDLNEENARKLHEYCWVFVHGIAVMIVTDYCKFSDEEINEMLSVHYMSLLNKFKEENNCENNRD